MNSSPRRKIRREEAGQTLVLFVLALAVLLGFTAMSIDVGLILHERRQLQNAADAAALAGVQELPDSSPAAVAMAQQYAAANGVDLTDPDYTFQATTPYDGDPGKIEVKVSRQVGFLFGRALGLDFATVPARAVAHATSGPNYAIFVGHPPGCGGDLDGEGELEGSNIFIDGAVHSDELEIDGDTIQVTNAVTYVCEVEMGGTNVTFGSGPTQLAQTPPLPVNFSYPSDFPYANFNYADFNCDFTVNGDMVIDLSTPQYWLDPVARVLQPGVYCATGDIDLVPNGVTGNVTFVAGDEVTIQGSDINLTARQYDVLAFAGGADLTNVDAYGDEEGEIELEGNNIHWVGMLLAPYGEIELEGNGLFSPSTLLLASEEIEIEGDNFDLTAYRDGVLAFAGGSDLSNVDAFGDDEGEIEVEGSNGRWVGMLLAPYGEIELEGDNLVSPSTLLLAGDEAEIEGDGISITAMELPGPAVVRLIE